MATINLTIGSVSATKTATNAIASALISDYVEAMGGPVSGTAQEKADWYIGRLARHTREIANEYRRRVLAEDAAVTSGLNGRDFT